MRRLLLVLLLAAPGLAMAASSDKPPPGHIGVPVSPALRLRGPVHDDAAPAVLPTPAAADASARPAIASAAPWSVAATPATADAGECRMGCSRTYYFCRNDPTPDDCAPRWSQCVSSCLSPNLDARLAPVP